MQPIPHWRRFLRRAWSVRFYAIAAVLQFASSAVPLFEGLPRWFVLAAIAGGIAAQFIDQGIATPKQPEEEPIGI